MVVSLLPKHGDYKNPKYTGERKEFRKRALSALSDLETLHTLLTKAYPIALAMDAAGMSFSETDEDSVSESGPAGVADDPAPPTSDNDPELLDFASLSIGTSYGSSSSTPSAAASASSASHTTSTAASTSASRKGKEVVEDGEYSGAAAATSAAATAAAAAVYAYPDTSGLAVSNVAAYVPHAEQQEYISQLRQKELEMEAEKARIAHREAEVQRLEAALAAERDRLAAAAAASAAAAAATAGAASSTIPPPSTVPLPSSLPPTALPPAARPTSVADVPPPSHPPPARSSSKPSKRASRRRKKKNKDAFRNIVVCDSMMGEFLRVAHPNTKRELEFCGILAGVCVSNVLYITTLIIPAQEATSDTVSTTDEESLWEYQMGEDLLTLGWIHTHPTQQCFMSSVDVHTHCAYQSMLPEAIAIVMAPRYRPNYGIFQLTTPAGLKTVQNCRLTGFHPHPSHIKIYDHARHVMMAGGQLKLKVVDLRRGLARKQEWIID